MIFITLGSQRFQFNRVLREIDKLIETNVIDTQVFAQVGFSDYQPRNYQYTKFTDKDKYLDLINKSDIVITHGGTGAIISAVKFGKKVIAIPRLKKYGEHVDNHQLEITNMFNEMKLIISINDIDELKDQLSKIDSIEVKQYVSNTDNIINSIEKRYIIIN